MKRKNVERKLSLRKVTVANLEKVELDAVKGGTWLDDTFEYNCVTTPNGKCRTNNCTEPEGICPGSVSTN